MTFSRRALHGREVDLGAGDLEPEVAGVADLGQQSADAQHRLGGDAGVVQAAPADARRFSTTAVLMPSCAARIAAT